ncbi:MAG: MerR family transcriptional regulator [Candidatus Merdivicinus sp.]|jgi:DNA-binding transcriptional MerR regulator
MSQKYFHTGEFAALCGVKKDTLLYYDKIGLLKPDFVAENGYRCYSVNQFLTLNTIQALQKIGTPLREIKSYMGSQSSERFLSLLTRKQDELRREITYLQELQVQMEETIATVRHAAHVPRGELLFERYPEEYLVATKKVGSDSDPEHQFLLTTREHFSHCRAHGYPELPVGEIVLSSEIADGSFVESMYFSKLRDFTEDPKLRRKPAGIYAVLYHQGNYDSLRQAYRDFAADVKKAGYQLVGEIYEEDQITMLSASDENSCLMKISARVSPIHP